MKSLTSSSPTTTSYCHNRDYEHDAPASGLWPPTTAQVLRNLVRGSAEPLYFYRSSHGFAESSYFLRTNRPLTIVGLLVQQVTFLAGVRGVLIIRDDFLPQLKNLLVLEVR